MTASRVVSGQSSSRPPTRGSCAAHGPPTRKTPAGRGSSAVSARSGPPAAGQRPAELEPEALEEAGNGLRPQLEAVPRAQPGDRVRVAGDGTAQIGELLEEALEAGRRDDLQ